MSSKKNPKKRNHLEVRRMNRSPQFRDDLVAVIPSLRAFAMSLSGRSDRADDLVQETLTKAWTHHDSFQQGTNLRAWLYTILRNEFYSQVRKRSREVEDVDGFLAANVVSPPAQIAHLELEDLRSGLAELPDDQREAILLVGASGFSYEEAAQICQVAVGTIKSRVSRARDRLSASLEGKTGAS
jgi:RNA polymerase sigma-70 factor, ECF subfamily